MADAPAWAAAALAAGLMLVLAVVWRRSADRARVRERLGAFPIPTSGMTDRQVDDRAGDIREPGNDEPFARRYPLLPLAAGVAVSATLYFALGLKPVYAATAGLIVTLIGNEIDRSRVARRQALIESQLADAIDLMVGALRAGGGVTAALENAVRESRWPLRPQLAEVLGRIRLGDDPQEVLRALTRRVPLENFILFASALSVHWEVGGSLAGTLATVGRAVRDRTELSRRVQSLTAQARASVAAVLLATYFIAVIIWRNDPGRMEAFLSTSIGAYLIGMMCVFQAIGVVWTTAATRIKF